MVPSRCNRGYPPPLASATALRFGTRRTLNPRLGKCPVADSAVLWPKPILVLLRVVPSSPILSSRPRSSRPLPLFSYYYLTETASSLSRISNSELIFASFS